MKQFIKCPECGEVQLLDIASLRYSIRMQYCKSCNMYFNSDLKPSPIPALSIKQPWAWLIVNGYKDIENRNTLKNFRGTFLIHAGKSFDTKNWNDTNNPNFTPSLNKKSIIHYGGIIGYAEIYDCVTKSDSPWFVGKNGLMIRNPKPLPFTPFKGKLSFFYPEID